jgi:hypothetical protein
MFVKTMMVFLRQVYCVEYFSRCIFCLGSLRSSPFLACLRPSRFTIRIMSTFTIFDITEPESASLLILRTISHGVMCIQ